MEGQSDLPICPNHVHRGIGKKEGCAHFVLKVVDIGRFYLTLLAIVGLSGAI